MERCWGGQVLYRRRVNIVVHVVESEVEGLEGQDHALGNLGSHAAHAALCLRTAQPLQLIKSKPQLLGSAESTVVHQTNDLTFGSLQTDEETANIVKSQTAVSKMMQEATNNAHLLRRMFLHQNQLHVHEGADLGCCRGRGKNGGREFFGRGGIKDIKSLRKRLSAS